MTNQEKKEYLRRYKAADDEINDLLREKERILSRLTRMTSSATGMPRGGGDKDPMTNGVAKMIELEREIDSKVDKLVELRREIEAGIETVDSNTQRRLLKLRYIDGMTWERVAVEMDYSYMQVCRLHGKALNALKML